MRGFIFRIKYLTIGHKNNFLNLKNVIFIEQDNNYKHEKVTNKWITFYGVNFFSNYIDLPNS